ncbi:ABC transporter permease subunit [Pseudonocardia oroxyli]|uniref:Spermidine/putrescine transport system permease protein n=1 Tax=Pseudonocardia oroxyli TaxID=366584 RepID=A0A1G7SSB5_PSEOR|nr:ABC transporter permease subunit [Pseudonocardia oroxyli]SDG25871.1 spermidine/putrescine transport system permease protein [Pseudonocardia oroxyli]
MSSTSVLTEERPPEVPPRPTRARLVGWLPAMPTLLLWALCSLAPVAVLVAYSFGQTDLVTYRLVLGWTLANYQSLAESFYLAPILRSVGLAAGTTVLCALVAFPVAYFVSRTRGRLRVVLLACVVIPYLTSFVVRAYAWLDLLSSAGPISDVLNSLGITRNGLTIAYSPTAIAIVLVYAYLPLMVLPMFVALDRLDLSLHTAASDLGANGRRTLRRVTIPLAKPGIYAGCLLVFIPALGEYTVPAIVGGGRTLMFGNIIADQFQGTGDYSLGAALSTSLTAIVLLCVVLLRGRTQNVTFQGGLVRGGRGGAVRRSPFLAAWTALVIAFLFLPILTVFANAFNRDDTLAGWGGFTFQWFGSALTDQAAVGAAVTSLQVALLCVVITLAITVPAALWARSASRRGQALLDVSTYMRIALPEVVFAVGLFILFRRLDLPLGLMGIVLGHVVLASAFAFVIVQTRLATMDTTLEQAGSDLGATPARVFRRVTLPLITPAVVGAGVLTFFVSADNVLTSLFMGAGNVVTLPVYIMSQVKFSVSPATNAIALLFVLAVMLVIAAGGVVVAAGRVRRRSKDVDAL